MEGELELDFDRFEYDKVETLGGETWWVKVGCHHRNREDVTLMVTGEVIAILCLDCNAQLPVGHP